MARRKARELAFRTLFQAERGGVALGEVWRQVRADIGEGGEEEDADAVEAAEAYGDVLDRDAIAFADELLRAFDEHRAEVDGELEAVIEGWSFPQMAQTDLNILRLALTEMRHCEVPVEVTIEMAVRLAKKFGGEESGRFVNGVLGRAFRSAEAPER